MASILIKQGVDNIFSKMSNEHWFSNGSYRFGSIVSCVLVIFFVVAFTMAKIESMCL
ncbi:hypothetical protein Bca101_073718 [Brassica carinata]